MLEYTGCLYTDTTKHVVYITLNYLYGHKFSIRIMYINKEQIVIKDTFDIDTDNYKHIIMIKFNNEDMRLIITSDEIRGYSMSYFFTTLQQHDPIQSITSIMCQGCIEDMLNQGAHTCLED